MASFTAALRRCSPYPSFIIACLLAITLQIFFISPISPDLLELPKTPVWSDKKLQSITKLGEGFLKAPEDVAVDENGVLYTATRDGWIKRLDKDGLWQNWTMLNSSTLLGITATKDGGIVVCDSEKFNLINGVLYTTTRDGWIEKLDKDGLWQNWTMLHSGALLGVTATKDGAIVVCDSEKGLLKAGENGFTTLLSHVNGSKLSFADDVIEASDGSLYFSVASTKFGLHEWYLDVLEAKPHGQLLKYEPSSNKTSLVLDNLGLANGVALSKDQDFLLICETWKFRCLKYWLKGEKEGETEIFIDNLPGAPDNINLAPDGSFWIALLQLTSDGWESIHTSKLAKHLAASFPKMIKLVNGVYKKAMVVNVGDDGKIIRKFGDSEGKVMTFVTSALEFEGHLYLGSLSTDFIGKLQLNTNS